MTDPYQVLGIPQTASKEEIKKAYRQKAKQYHPDLHPDDPKAVEKMNEVNIAYDMLNNPEKYQQASQPRGYGSQKSYGYGDRKSYGYGSEQWQEDIFGSFFGNRYQTEIPKPQVQSGDSQAVRQAVDFINMGNYRYALQILNQIISAERNARWYYLSALANRGMENMVAALEQIKKAIQLEPDNQIYRQLLNSMQYAGYQYEQAGQDYTRYAKGMGTLCFELCLTQFCCMFCC